MRDPSMSTRAKLIRDLIEIQHALMDSKTPRKRSGTAVSKLGQPQHQLDSFAWLMNFHARIPSLMARARRGDVEPAIYMLGYARGIASGLLFS